MRLTNTPVPVLAPIVETRHDKPSAAGEKTRARAWIYVWGRQGDGERPPKSRVLYLKHFATKQAVSGVAVTQVMP